MPKGTSSYDGLAVSLYGEHELKQVTSATDFFTLTGASTTGTGTLLTIQNSDETPAVNGLRVYDYGRTRIIRTDDVSHGGTYNNALDVKVDLNYAAGAQQYYAGTFILDTAGGSTSGGRGAVITLQWYGDSAVGNGMAYSFIHFADLGSTEVGSIFTILGNTTMFETISDPACSRGLIIYVDNEKFWIQVASAST